ncbi:MAG: alanine racemase, partial [Acidobacteriaceae bacterium]
MIAEVPAALGMPLHEVDTPSLLIDLDAFERNLRRMADAAKLAGVALRPHAKTHKSPAIALRQIELGAVGVCCQKVSEAEAMVQGGVQDVLISNEIVGHQKLERLARLARQARIGVCVDNVDNVAALSAAASRHQSTVDVLVEIDVGSH